MRFELVTKLSYPATSTTLHLFRHVETGKAALISRELAAIMGYRNFHFLLQENPFYAQGIHSWMIVGGEIRDFKEYLARNRIYHSKKSSKLLLVNESGVSLLLSKSCKSSAIIAGEWLFHEVFPLLRESNASINHAVMGGFIVVNHNGRFAVLEAQLASLIAHPQLTSVFRGCHRYIDKVHFAFIPGKLLRSIPEVSCAIREENLLLYESGIYRYLSHIESSKARYLWSVLKDELQLLRQETIAWSPLPTGEEWESICRESTTAFTPGIGELTGIHVRQLVDEIDRKLEDHRRQHQEEISKIMARIDGFLGFFEDFFPHIQGKFRDIQKTLEELVAICKREQEDTPDLLDGKKLAKQLGVYFLDRKTPQIVFVKALVAHTGFATADELQLILSESYGVKKGVNVVKLGDSSYRFWKS